MEDIYNLREIREALRLDVKKELEKLHVKKMLSAYCIAKPMKPEHNLKTEQCNTKPQPILPELPQVVVDPKTGKRYFRGRMLGKGGFARCYEVTDMQTDRKYACKAIAKARIAKPHQKEKIVNEVELHKSLSNRYVVQFHGFFEDDDNVYILLELCSRKSLVQLLKQRRTLTEPEVRHFMYQAIQGVNYLHNQRVIHRDIKLGNLFLNHDMEIRIGDFGLAVRADDNGRKEMSVCGTPNYIAPEVLGKGGHGHEVDIWALGCVMYTLLVGRPPFETNCLKDTYMRIRNNEYAIPSRVSRSSAKLIQRLLSDKPEDRPSLSTILQDDFFTRGFFPNSLPPMCFVAPPKFTTLVNLNSKSNSKTSKNSFVSRKSVATTRTDETMKHIKAALSHMTFAGGNKRLANLRQKKSKTNSDNNESGVESEDSNVNELATSRSFEEDSSQGFCSPQPLHLRLSACLESLADHDSSARSDPISTGTSDSEEEQCPALLDLAFQQGKRLWITKWVDYSNKYGFGAQLSNGCLVIRFNDGTTLALAGNKKSHPLLPKSSRGALRLQYFDEDRNLFRFSMTNIPEDLGRKVTLLNYFGNYMDKHLLKGGDMEDSPLFNDQTEIPIIDTWFRTEKAMVMYLTDGTLQVNFLADHTKIVITPDAKRDIVTYINRCRESTGLTFKEISKKGCNEEITERLQYCKMVLQKLTEIYLQGNT